MRHDLDLVRKILIAIEDMPPDPAWESLHLDGYDDSVVGEHVRILAEAGFIEMQNMSNFAESIYCPTALTWQGGLLLDSIRNDTVWAKVKAFAQTVGQASFPILLERLADYASTLNIPPSP